MIQSRLDDAFSGVFLFFGVEAGLLAHLFFYLFEVGAFEVELLGASLLVAFFSSAAFFFV